MKFKLSDCINILSRTPKLLEDLLVNLPVELIMSNEGEESWSPYDIVGHLIHGEKTDWIPRTKIILGNKTDKAFIPFDRFAQFENSKGKTIQELLDEFKSLRTMNINTLKDFDLTESQLSLTGIHPEFGEINLRQLLATWQVHDLSHINQITRVISRQYIKELGPWTSYISIMQ